MSALQWVLVALACCLIEIFTVGLWFLWLALAALLTALGVRLGVLTGLEAQLLIFSVFTLAFLVFTRPLALKFFKTNDTPSNMKAVIGQHGVVTKAISPLEYGQVKVNGEIWTASAQENLDPDVRIQVVAVQGVKLVVEKASEQ
ncbi:MAG: NfeD family protein [Syntrophomonadaceae bacterium]|jgi:membrane protein implicated in regulation of membrane protease activity